ncbi:MAG: hypothetical protein JSS76_00410 [Bacteroidetes bacterium]|nr:hypothetical protein [Bacteroidota bacterium]
MSWLIFIAVIVLVYWLINRTVENPQRWGHSFDNLQFSSEDFYKSVEEAVKKREVPEVRFSRVNYSEGGIMSANREYLHIVRHELIFDICAAPFGTGFFVSVWSVDKPDFFTKLFRKIEALAPWVERKTYYQIDTIAMYRGAVHDSVMDAIDQMTNAKGVRKLTELERMFNDRKI